MGGVRARILLAMAVAACGGGGTDPEGSGNDDPPSDLRLEQVVTGLTAPVFLTHVPGDTRLFVVEQVGRIRVVENGALRAAPFLDIQSLVRFQGEQGLLSMAFHPNYSGNGFFYVYYIDQGGSSQVVRYTATGNTAAAASALTLMTIPQPFANHNGGQLAFGPDNRLYVGLGDGGSGGDPMGNGQNTATLLGAVLRIDVDNPDPGREYGVPGDNPFVGDPAAAPEIWIYGVRNPWRFSFDTVDGLVYVADVGQNAFEEVTVAAAGDGGLNFGWNVMEGTSCYNAGSCDMTGLTLPILQYDNTGFAGNCSITGGYVYRGTALSGLQGHYFYSDYCGGFLRSFRVEDGNAMDQKDWGVRVGGVTSFGRDGAGELYMLLEEGTVLRIVPGQ